MTCEKNEEIKQMITNIRQAVGRLWVQGDQTEFVSQIKAVLEQVITKLGATCPSEAPPPEVDKPAA